MVRRSVLLASLVVSFVVGCSGGSLGGGCPPSLFNVLLGGSSSGAADCINVSVAPQAIAVDAGTCGGEAGGDDACLVCLNDSCCAEGLACRAEASCTGAPDPTYLELASCAETHCASECPELP